MNFKKRIHKKMMFYFLGTSLLVYVASLWYVGLEVKSISKDMANNDLVEKSDDLSNKVKGMMDGKIKIVETLASTMQNFESIDEPMRRPFYTKMLRSVIAGNTDIVSIWSIWEPGSIDMLDEENTMADDGTGIGSYMPSFYRQGDDIKVSINADMPPYGKPLYSIPRETMKTVVLDPFKYSNNENEDSILVSAVIAPISMWGEFMGVVGIYFTVDEIQGTLSQFQKETKEQVCLISGKGNYIFAPDKGQINMPQTILPYEIDSLPQDTTYVGADFKKKNAITIFKKIDFENTQWCLVSALPVKDAYAEANKSLFNVIVLIIAGFLLLTLVISIVAKNISKAIVTINNKLAGLSLGIINKSKDNKSLFENEITDLTNSLDNLFDSLQASVDFAGEIGKGNLDTKYNLLSDDDTLGTSLITMQDSLKVAKVEEDKKKLLDDQRNWVTHGLANFGEIIRQDNDNVEDFALNLLSQLLKYVDVVQGAIYFKVEDKFTDELKFENKAAIAYGKQVMLDTTVTEKDGLFGRVITEQKIIYLEDVPDNYVSFTQGKKEAQKPRNLLLVPMVVNDEIFGIMELVSYNHLEKYKIEFVEKLCENIASVISSVNTNIHNAHLLEQSNEQAEELSQHEEEMRQNLEEMQATQEEATKRHDSLNAQIDAFYNGLMVAEIDLNGDIIKMSNKMMKFYDISTDSVQGSSYIAVIAQDDAIRESYKDFWTELLAKGKAQRIQETLIRGKQLRTHEFYMVINKDDEPYRVIVVAINNTREIELNERLMIELQSYMKEHGMSEEEK